MKSKDLGLVIRKMLLAGKRNTEICRILSVSSPTVSHHRKALELPKVAAGGPRPPRDWKPIQAAYDSGVPVPEIRRQFNLAKSTWLWAVGEGKIVAEKKGAPDYISLESYARQQMGVATRAVRFRLKEKMLKEGTKYECALCFISEWRGEYLDLRLDHVNGDSGDHKPGNLRLVCPNCDSQLPTFSHRNVGRKNCVTKRDDAHLWEPNRQSMAL